MYNGQEVRTCQEVTAETRGVLIKNGIKPGTKGIVVSEVTYVTVNFGGKLVTLKEDAVEGIGNSNAFSDDEAVNNLMGIFGMSK